jgi:curved DNA-binding protein
MQGEDHHAKILVDLNDSFFGASRSISLQMPQEMPDGRVVSSKRTLKVSIPKGIRQGQQIRLAKQGGAGVGEGDNGDLYLEIEFARHPLYHVEGKDVYLDLPVTPWEAALGATIKTPTPVGVVDLKVPANSVSGRKMRLKGRGIPAQQPGDLYVVLQVALPPSDNESALQAYREFHQAVDFNPRSKLEV